MGGITATGERIRMAGRDDAKAIRQIYAPYVENTPISFELDPPDASEMTRRISRVLETHPWLVCEDGEGVRGYAYGSRFHTRAAYRWSCEVSVYLASDARGRGMGRRLYLALFDLLDRQGYRQALAGVTLPNAASVGLHESMGFQAIGVQRDVGFKFGTWHDVGWWQRALGESTTDPQPVVAIGRVASEVDWAHY